MINIGQFENDDDDDDDDDGNALGRERQGREGANWDEPKGIPELQTIHQPRPP